MGNQSLTTKLIVALADAKETPLEVVAKASCHVFRGYETVVDGHVIDDGIDIECLVDASLASGDDEIMSISGTSDEIPRELAASWLRPRDMAANTSRDADITKVAKCDLADVLSDMLESPLDYVDDETQLADALAEAISEELTDVSQSLLGVHVDWDV